MKHHKTFHPEQGWSLNERDPQFIETMMPYWEWFYRHYFRVKTSGWHHIPSQGPVLLVGSHNGGLASPDTSMMMYDWFCHFGTERPAYGLMHQSAWAMNSLLSRLAAKTGAVRAHPKMAIAALKQDAGVLVYPGGAQDVFRPYTQRHKIELAGRKGFIKLALREKVTIIPLISIGAHETLFILGDFYEQAKQLHQWGIPWLYDIDPEVFPIYLGLPWGLGIGPLPNFPLPIPIHTRVCPPICFEKYGREAANDRIYVDACYDLIVATMQQELDQLVAETMIQ
ncbi:lysophospholipid acyltransferase family protein [Crocosphaera sp. XPORK-15E]|uniref:lysophospholipid acyltransferase family protein n=1 Tax=Crocosphaera sp. XPORK-15E TaxID=3110247 RepID=UPI002B212C34|nr:lysophospholipid acyltransferase family protein [Crocosphaera sp. XPORK-15E]MEA5535581.1 lysophospholipid acyltransferase family protein [Crocosphaera sp. XPORK-15E]